MNTEWNGEGLPPVGTVCEWKGQMGGYWVTSEVVALSGKQIVLRHANDGQYRPGLFEVFTLHLQFRPIRTPEQIAAEERNAAIGEMLDGLSGNATYGDIAHRICAQIYDAGYRKVTP